MPIQARASVLIVSYNSRADLPRCLTALQQTLPPACETILVDNASDDSSADLVQRDFPWIKLIRSPANIGFAAATNRAAEVATGRYLIALNPDTEVVPGWVEALLAPLERGTHINSQPVGLTTPRILLTSTPDLINTCGNSMHFTGITVCRGLGQKADAPQMGRPAAVSAVSGACFAISRELWRDLGGLDEIFFTYLEDTDLSLRARLAGYACMYVPQAVVYHDYASRFSAAKFYYLERNRLLLLAKCLHPKTLVLLLPALAVVEALTWGFALKGGPAYIQSKAHSYRWLAQQRQLIRARHRRVQVTRRVSDSRLIRGMAPNLDISQLTSGAIAKAAGAILNPFFRRWHHLAIVVADPIN